MGGRWQGRAKAKAKQLGAGLEASAGLCLRDHDVSVVVLPSRRMEESRVWESRAGAEMNAMWLAKPSSVANKSVTSTTTLPRIA